MKIKRFFQTFFASILCFTALADTGRYRLMFNDDPATEITIGFETYGISTSKPILYYSTNYINTSSISTYNFITEATSNFSNGMSNHFITLKNLQPNTVYYFTINYRGSFSDVFNFKTLSNNNNTKLSILAAGDTQNQSQLTKTAFEIFSKLNPHFLLFQGDFTKQGSDVQWQQWFDDWQLSISQNKRIIPIVVTRGNLENNDRALENLFNCSNNIFKAHTFGKDLLRVYTLNSEISIYGNQTKWLSTDLNSNNNVIWKLAHYHTAMRPHSLFKREGSRQYANWANLFNQYNVNVAIEGEGQNLKVTLPVKPCSGGFSCDQGFTYTNSGGTVYLGEGTLDCPLRYDADLKKWTRYNAVINQFKWIFIDANQIELRTVAFKNTTDVNTITQLNDNNRFTIPQSLEIWNPDGGDFVLFEKNSLKPNCTIIEPGHNSHLPQIGNCLTIIADAESANGISKVDFFANGFFVGSSVAAPYLLSWYPASGGNHIISAKATDNIGNQSSIVENHIFIGNSGPVLVKSSIDINCEELYETSFGSIFDKNFKIKVTDDLGAVQGLQFTDLNIPPKAKILSANIQFTAAASSSLPASASIRCEKSNNASPFIKKRDNISSRPLTNNYVTWQVPNWTKDERTANQKTSDLSSIIQEVVDMPDWSVESPISFITSGTGYRNAKSEYSIADSINQNKIDVPVLSVEYIASCPYNLFVSTCELSSDESFFAQNILHTNQPITSGLDNIAYFAGTELKFDNNFEVNKSTNFIADVKICY